MRFTLRQKVRIHRTKLRWSINLWRAMRQLDREIKQEDPKGAIGELTDLRKRVIVLPRVKS